MALLGLSLILASFVWFCMRRPVWFPSIFGGPPRPAVQPPPQETPERGKPGDGPSDADSITRAESKQELEPTGPKTAVQIPVPLPVVQHEAGPDAGRGSPNADSSPDEQTTPKASATTPEISVPSFALSTPEPPSDAPKLSAPTLMPPPPRPPTLRPPQTNSTSSSAPSLSPAPRRTGNLPIPPRGQPGCSTLAPPPTHSSKPAKPSRAVSLSPGHSPLDWARLSGHPTADLRGLPPGTPYLRVTPSMLKRQTGRKGKDAWTVLGGKVYNISPYLPFHPGGEPELLRGAGRDGTRLFGEIHPWVNYEGMLAACLVGIYVPEEEGDEAAGGAGAVGGDLEAMD
ncbi:hypothetical protein C8A03DRAFT_30642 [Achaetomium macrosporum]|uniref:Cytochrome b5 heme-binding domain-containing protein n=1 Tax=Achaetomium macrosporum TaxID=79813 RepID=A0AAN7CFK4_9PEZI|nr:hypothetical protein C8A03DRAFT_30642 [Achaetomium macrosporum]